MDFLIYKLLAPIIMGFILLSIGISLKYIHERITKLLLCYQIFVLFYLFFNYLEFISMNESFILLFAKFQHLCIQMIALFWFLFALTYTGYDWLLRKFIVITICIIVVINMTIVFTAEYHGLFYSDINFIEKLGYVVLRAKYGMYFWIKIAFDYVFLIAGTVFIIVSYVWGESYFRAQSLLILIGFIFPLCFNILYVYRIIPNFQKDFSSISFAFTGLFLFISIYRYRLLHFTPIARNLILHSLEEGIVTLNSHLEIIDFNSKASAVFELTDRLLGLNYFLTKIGMYLDDLDSILENSESFSKMCSIGNIQYEIRIKKVYNLTNIFKGLIISTNDITDKMRLIDEKIYLIKELEGKNRELKEIHEALILQEKMALLGSLSAGIAHEINNPLSFVKSNLGVINRFIDKPSSELEEIIRDSTDGINRISEVVSNLLNFSRSSSANKDKEYSINSGVESSLVISKNQYRYKANIKLELGDVPLIYTTGNELNQVLLNLITNAAHAIPNGSENGFIKIKTFYSDYNVICEISDNGEAIKNKESIFEPFYTTKNQFEGTGLGLSISKKIIEDEFSGKLYLKESDIKTFRIEIPVPIK